MIYSLVLVTPPADEPISIEEAKHHLKMDEIDEDNVLIADLIKTVRQSAEAASWEAFVTQEWKMMIPRFPCIYEYGDDARIELKKPPLQSVTHVKYIDEDGAQQTLAEGTDYTVHTHSYPGFIVPAYGQNWPYARCQPDAIEIQFKCGYGNADAVPGAIKDKLKLTLAYLYANRGEVDVEYPKAIDRLLQLNRTVPV